MALEKLPDAELAMTPERAMALATTQAVGTDALTWMVVHGAVCLALRHPAFAGPSRQRALQFVRQLGQGLVRWGCLSADELALCERTEAEVSPHGGG
jgi:hypothetical protein